MIHNLSEQNTLLTSWMSEIRNVAIQNDRMRFRRNLERIGEIAAYEISKTLEYEGKEFQTPLGECTIEVVRQQPVLATILRAGLPLHQGLLNYFDHADCAFLASFRKHHKDGSFEINHEYLTSPKLDNRPLILSDPMLATGSSLVVGLKSLLELGKPSSIHIVSAIATSIGIEKVQKQFPEVHFWLGDIDEELTAKGYIVPGLGDAGDLCFGPKEQY